MDIDGRLDTFFELSEEGMHRLGVARALDKFTDVAQVKLGMCFVRAELLLGLQGLDVVLKLAEGFQHGCELNVGLPLSCYSKDLVEGFT